MDAHSLCSQCNKPGIVGSWRGLLVKMSLPEWKLLISNTKWMNEFTQNFIFKLRKMFEVVLLLCNGRWRRLKFIIEISWKVVNKIDRQQTKNSWVLMIENNQLEQQRSKSFPFNRSNINLFTTMTTSNFIVLGKNNQNKKPGWNSPIQAPTYWKEIYWINIEL